MIKATQGNPKALCKREAERWGQIRRCENGNKGWGDSRPRSKEWSFLKVRQSKEMSSPGALRGLPVQPCVQILCICSVCVCTCVYMCEERESHVLGHLACVEVRGQPQGLVLAFQRLLSLFTVYVRVAGIGPSMVSLLFIPISHRSTEIQTDVGVLGIQTSSHIFVASVLPTEPHHQPHKMCCLCK